MAKVNVYDFDKTILPYDSTAAFTRFAMLRHPGCIPAALPAVLALPAYLLRAIDKTREKEIFYRFLRRIPDVDAEVAAFWDENFGNINAWYLEKKRPDDIVSSASPEFLLRPAADRLGVRLIASRVDKHTGRTTGKNNHGEEKTRRLDAEYPGTEIAEFFSDSHSDDPLARRAERAWLVKGRTLLPWD